MHMRKIGVLSLGALPLEIPPASGGDPEGSYNRRFLVSCIALHLEECNNRALIILNTGPLGGVTCRDQ